MKKILTVLGARPQFVKAATVSRAAKEASLEEIIVHTGQHFDANMSDVFFDEMNIPRAHYHLDIHGLQHGAMTGRMLEKIENVIVKEKPDAVLVYGDTNSTLAGALAATKLHIPIAHVEAGLRSFNMQMPEEINRIVTDRISRFLFCPTKTAVQNLENEGFKNFNIDIFNVGDVMYDAVLYYKDLASEKSDIIERLALTPNQYILVTLHRAENTDDPLRLKSIVDALNQLSEKYKIVLPLHPRTRSYLTKNNITINANVIDPVGYFDMLNLLTNCKLVMTDSGGLQKEAYFFSKFCLTLRDQTEWVELVEEGANLIVGADTNKILSAFQHAESIKVSGNSNLYGKGDAAKLIVEKLQSSM